MVDDSVKARAKAEGFVKIDSENNLKETGFEFSHSFTNDRGNEVNQYKIKGGGYARLEKYKDGYVVSNIILENPNRGKGYATKLYKELNKESIDETNKPLQSIKPDENGTIELSKDGKALWESFVKKGIAEIIGKNRYKFIK